MRIIFCHERFIPRFGVDRVLISIARELKNFGHDVALVGYKIQLTDNPGLTLIEIPESPVYIESDIHFCEWITNNWKRIQRILGGKIDVALSAGWPAFSVIPFFKQQGCLTVYNDHGIAPAFGLSEGTQKTLGLLQKLKSLFVPSSDLVIPVSQFIGLTQSQPVLGSRAILHKVLNAFNADYLTQEKNSKLTNPALDVDILLLGRYEAGSYKQSEHLFSFASKLKQVGWIGKIGVLEFASKLQIPVPLQDHIVACGHPKDQEMYQLIRRAKLAVCFSCWEGFNLPLAESQSCGVPCLVYNVGAHSEVVANTWQLCDDIEEMVTKANGWLSNPNLLPISLEQLINHSVLRTWQTVTNDYLQAFEHGLKQKKTAGIEPVSFDKSKRPIIFYECRNACLDTANSGVVRVSRRLGAEMQKYAQVVFVIWDSDNYRFRLPHEFEWKKLSAFNGPTQINAQNSEFYVNHLNQSGQKYNQDVWLFLPEIRHEPDLSRCVDFAKKNSIQIASIFYDAIPLLRPDLVLDKKYRDGHIAYMRILSEFELVISISNASAYELKKFWQDENRKVVAQLQTCLLPGGDLYKKIEVPTDPPALSHLGRNYFLCVSTLEPRKNHIRLIKAFLKTKASKIYNLILVGNKYSGAEHIFEEINEAVLSHNNIKYLGVLDDLSLEFLYKNCVATIYPSEIEGFGLPILESLQFNKPCICHNEGVMAEIASGGGCLTANVKDIASLSATLDQLLEHSTYNRLIKEAEQRSVKTWVGYGVQILSTLSQYAAMNPIYERTIIGEKAFNPESILFNKCWFENWQMNDAERIGMLGVLQKIKPSVSIEVGTFHAGSLSLIRQFSKVVFSIDIDNEVAEKYAFMENVSFITGDSVHVLPILLEELACNDMSPEFILIDGDHSLNGVCNDMNSLIDYQPRKTCVVMFHNSANLECRQGVLRANWDQAEYVHYIDLDFIPGRIIEHTDIGRGQTWGGLGLAILSPTRRSSPLVIRQSAYKMINHLHNYVEPSRT